MNIDEFMTDLVDDIKLLANEASKKCYFLSDRGESFGDKQVKYARVLRLCQRLRKNASSFEDRAIQGLDKYQVKLPNNYLEELKGDVQVAVRVGQDIDVIETPSSDIQDLDQFRANLKTFLHNYSKNPNQKEQTVLKDSSTTTVDKAAQTEAGTSGLQNEDEEFNDSLENAMLALFNDSSEDEETQIITNGVNENKTPPNVETNPEVSEGLSKVDNYEATKRIQDELMYVTAEVPYQSEETLERNEKRNETSNDEQNKKEMTELMDWYNKDDSDADSDSSESSNATTVMYSEPEINEIVGDTKEKTEIVADTEGRTEIIAETEQKNESPGKNELKKNVADPEDDCATTSCASTDSEEDKDIDRLCDLSNLERSKKCVSQDSTKKKKGIKRRRKKLTSNSESETSDLSDFDSVSDPDITNSVQEAPEPDNEPVDPSEILSQIIADLTHTTDDDNSSSVDDEEPENRSPRKKCGRKSSSKEEPKKEKGEQIDDWRNDPLLKQRFDTPKEKSQKDTKENYKRSRSDSDESEFFRRSKRIRTNRMHLLSDSSSSTTELETSDDDDENDKVVKRKDSDSDCEIVSFSGAVPFDMKQEAEHDKLRRRKNILSVLSDENLDEETQRAGKEEEERVMRLEKRLQLKISQSQENVIEGLVLDITKDGYEISVDEALSRRAYQHQIEGLKFMWDACYENVDDLKNMEGTGCILAHSMGLGKTYQVFMLVHTLFRHEITGTKHVLIICPLSTVSGWLKEFLNGLKIAKHNQNMRLLTIESSSSSFDKYKRVLRWKQQRGVLILGYEAFEKLTNPAKKNASESKQLREALMDPGPDLVVCDEGHLLKNGKTLRTKALMQIRTKRRIALTGTPLQNNLSEYYHMVQFVKPNLLGTKHEFNRQFANPIMNGQYEDSSEFDIQLMKKRSHVLHRLLKNTVQRYESNILKQHLHSMKDYALFIQLHPVQEKLYRKYIEMVRTERHPFKKGMKTFFADYQVAKFICSHPFLLYTMETQNAERGKKKIVEMDTISVEPEVQEVEGVPLFWWKSECPVNVKTELEFGTKLHVMMGIIEEAEKINEKVLIFTSSLVELNSIEYFLKLKGTSGCPSWKSKEDYFRMDGTVPPCRRTQMCDIFNSTTNPRLRVFLMSHKVGGLGLNLTAANRVILLGANFNPSYDLQSIYRAYRFGQEKPVYIYRLLSMGTMEEKIYNRCVSKLAIASRVVDKHQIARHYKNLDLDDLYTISIDLTLQRSTLAKPDDDLLANVLLKYECIYKYHHHEKLLENRPDEDLNEEDKVKAWEEFKLLNSRENSTVPPTQNPPPGLKKNPVLLSTNPSLPANLSVPPAPRLDHPTTIRNIMQARMEQVYPLGRNTALNPDIMAGIQKYLSNDPLMRMTPTTSTTSRLIQPNPMLQPNPLASKENSAVTKKQPPALTKLPPKLTSGPKKQSEILKPKAVQEKSLQHTWRASSSDDFQKPPDFTVVPVRNRRTSCISNRTDSWFINKTSGNSNRNESVVIPDDDDVILVSSTGIPAPASRSSERSELQETVEKLNRSNITLTSVPKPLEDDDLIVLT